MVVSSTISTSPTMIYFGQEVGESANEQAGFGSASRTSIFDYIGVPHHQNWLNNKKFDGGQLSESEKKLREFYKRLLNFTIGSSALMGSYREIHYFNREHTANYNHRIFSFVRWSADEKLIIVSNFDTEEIHDFELKVPEAIISEWGLKDGNYQVSDRLFDEVTTTLKVESGMGKIYLKLEPLASLILALENS